MIKETSAFFWVFFALAAFLGAFLRWRIAGNFAAPWGTLSVNLLGSVFIGFGAIFLNSQPDGVKLILLTAFLGALTTYSSFSLDLVKLISQGSWGLVGAYFFLSNGLCLLGCFMGWRLANYIVNSP